MFEPIRFYYRNAVHAVDDAAPTRTILQHLREDLHRTGTKEGCAEGDCGACTVVIGTLQDGVLQMKAVNSCIQFLPTLDGRALFTVEDLQQPDGALHPVQQAMVDCHGSQCGFCTPGFVMSLWALYLARATTQQGAAAPAAQAPHLSRREIDDALSGNLCRCTGYRPIIDAAHRMTTLPAVAFDASAVTAALHTLERSATFAYAAAGRNFLAPRSLQQLVALRAAHPAACILAGSTDVGLWVTKQLRALGDILYLGNVAALRGIAQTPDGIEIGAAVSLEDAFNALCRHYPGELAQMRQRFASLPIRNAGTLGGNVANGSPIGDAMPFLIALGAQVVLRGSAGQRVLALEDFYLGYQQKDLRVGEFVEAIRLPARPAQQRFRTYKVAKRFDQDISAVCGAFALLLDGEQIVQARIAFGGMAATPKRALQAEAALRGQPWSEASLQAGMAAIAAEYAPLSDMRASAGYRTTVAQNLLRRFWLETRSDAPLLPHAVDVFASLPASST